MESNVKEIVQSTVRMLDEHKGLDIKLYGGRGICDCMIVVSADSKRQVKALTDRLTRFLKDSGFGSRLEGYDSADWVLIDLDCVLIHLFKNDVREYYQVDDLWSTEEVWI